MSRIWAFIFGLWLSSCGGELGLIDLAAATARDGGQPSTLADSTTRVSTQEAPAYDAGREAGGSSQVTPDAGTYVPPPPAVPTLPAVDDGWGVPVNDFPNWQERTLLVLTNGVRAGPQEWKTQYMARYVTTDILREEYYPPVAPLSWNLSLNQVARQHSSDMAKPDCGFNHVCYGKTQYDRITSAYGGSRAGENIASGVFNSPLDVVNLWICETGSACFPDGAGDLHRSAIMAPGFRELGVGQYRSPRNVQFYTQDFGGGLPVAEHLLVAGSHLLWQGRIRFLANVYDSDGVKPTSVRVVLGSSSLPLTLQLGADANGMYFAEAPQPATCESYHFEAVDSSGQTWRYPSRGRFLLFGVNGCASDYAP